MTTPTSARHELYTRLVDVLHEGPAETLMSYLPDTESGGLATKDALSATELALRADLTSVEQSLKTDIADVRHGLRHLTTIVVSGLFGIVAVIIATSVAG